MYKLSAILLVACLAGACKDKEKNEKVREDIREKMENVGDKIDTTMDKMRDGLNKLKDTLKSKIHRATEPDTL